MNGVSRAAMLITGVWLATACGSDPSGPAKIETVDQLLARVCEVAAGCPGVTATQQDIDDCPLDIKSQLGPDEIAELSQFTALTIGRQGTVLQCIGTAICSRFGGGLSSISDSDMMEPYRDCMAAV